MIGAIATGVSMYNTVAPVAGDIWTDISGIFGGGGRDTCPNEPSVMAVQFMMQSLTPAERTEFVRLYRAAAGNDPYATDPKRIAHDMAGGDDCKVSSSTGKAFSDFGYRMLSRYSQGVNVPTSYTDSADKPTIGSVVGSIWDDLKTAGGNVIGGTIEGAVAGATGAAQGAATGSDIGRSSVSVTNLLLIVAGFLLVFFLSKK